MKYIIYLFLILLSFSSCKEKQGEEREAEKNKTLDTLESHNQFVSEKFQLVLEYPENFEISEDSLPGKAPLINVFRKGNKDKPPFGIHEDLENAYISFLPKGFGVDGPSSTQKSVEEFGNPLPLSFEINENKSRVYLMNNGEVWGFYIRFTTPPESWGEFGGIFISYTVRDFKARCKNSRDEEKPMEQCDPMAGDEVLYFGEVDKKSKKEIDKILESLWFKPIDYERKKISDLIDLKSPVSGKTVKSPLEITGKARGQWFFEATAPVELLDGNFQSLGKSYIEVVNADWMTEEFVPFQGSLEFKKPGTKNGYLLLKKSNASGKPELDQRLRIPVKF